MYVRKDLVEDLKKDFPHLKAQTIHDAVNFIFSWIIEAVAENDRVILTNFGTFTTIRRKFPVANEWNKELNPNRDEEFFQLSFKKSNELIRKLRIKDE